MPVFKILWDVKVQQVCKKSKKAWSSHFKHLVHNWNYFWLLLSLSNNSFIFFQRPQNQRNLELKISELKNPESKNPISKNPISKNLISKNLISKNLISKNPISKILESNSPESKNLESQIFLDTFWVFWFSWCRTIAILRHVLGYDTHEGKALKPQTTTF